MVTDADIQKLASEPQKNEQDEFDKFFGEGADVDPLLQSLNNDDTGKDSEALSSIPEFKTPPKFVAGGSRLLSLTTTVLRLVVFTTTLALAVIWLGIFRLASHPVDLGFFIPAIEDTKASWPREIRDLKLTDIVIDWDKEKGALRVQAHTDGSDIQLGETSTLSLSQRITAWVSTRQLLDMNFKPFATTVLNPLLRLDLGSQVTKSQGKPLAFSTGALGAGQDIFNQNISPSTVESILSILENLAPKQGHDGFEIHRPIVEVKGHSEPLVDIQRITIVRSQQSRQSWTLTAILNPQVNKPFEPSGHLTFNLNAYPDRNGFDISVAFKNIYAPTGHFGTGCNRSSINGQFSTYILSGKPLPPVHLNASLLCVQKSLTAPPQSWDLSAAKFQTEISFSERTLEFKSLQLELSENNSINATGRVSWPSQTMLGDIASANLLPSRIEANLVANSQNHDFSLIGLPSAFGIETASAFVSATFPEGRLENSKVNFQNINILSTNGANVSGDVQITPETLLSSTRHLHPVERNIHRPDIHSATSNHQPAISITMTIEGVNESSLAEYWPTQSGAEARAWLLSSLTHADIKTAELELDFSPTSSTDLTSTSLKATRFVGQFTVDDMKLKLFKNASAQFPRMNLVVTDELTRLSASEATMSGLRFSNVFVEAAPEHALESGDSSFVRIQADVNSNLRQQLNFLSWKPLNVLSSLPSPILNATGFATTHINMSWPLKHGISWETLKVNAYSHIVNTHIGFGENLITSKAIHATLEDKVLQLDGIGDFKGKPFNHSTQIDIKHDGVFSGETHIDTVLNLSQTNFQNSQILTLEGIAPLRLSASYRQGEDLVYKGQLDLSDIKITSPFMGWSKPAGMDAQILLETTESQGLLSEEGLTETPINLSCISATLICETEATISPKAGLQQLVIKSFAMTPDGQSSNAQTVGRGSINIASDHSINIAANFKSLTIDTDILKQMFSEKFSAGAASVDIDAKLSSLKVSNLNGKSLNNFKGKLVKKTKNIETLLLQFETEPETDTAPSTDQHLSNHSKESFIALTSHESQNILQADVVNFGHLINFIGGKNPIVGGHVELISSQQISPNKNAPWIFDLKLQNYVLSNTPFILSLFKALTLGTPEDALLARGLSFSQGKAQGRYEDKRFVIDKFTSSGGNMGLSGRGDYDFRQDEIFWTGEIVPLNLMNSTVVGIIGAVPIVGNIVTGGEKSGIFALRYDITGSWSKPVYISNPPSLLVPGMFRNIFFPDTQPKENITKR